jgi:hypothetical protein
MLVKFANPTLIYKDRHYSQSLATLLLMQQSHLSSTHCHLITSRYVSVSICSHLPKLGALATYPFPDMLVKFANPTLIYKDRHYSQPLSTLLLMQHGQLSSTILEVGMYLLAFAHIYLNWEY